MVSPGFNIRNIWSETWHNRLAVALSWDVWAAILLASLLTKYAKTPFLLKQSMALFQAELGVVSAILGIILAGLAILVLFVDSEYLKILSKTLHGFSSSLFPFRFAATLATWSITSDIIMIVMSGNMTITVLRISFWINTLLFFWSVFATLNLVSSVSGHALNRGLQVHYSEPGK